MHLFYLLLNLQEGFTLAVMHIGAPACGMQQLFQKFEKLNSLKS